MVALNRTLPVEHCSHLLEVSTGHARTEELEQHYTGERAWSACCCAIVTATASAITEQPGDPAGG